MRVYHLLTAKYALEDLANRQLKVARFQDLNDPFELLALELSNPEDRHRYDRWRNDAADAFGLLCFSRTWRSPVMWSHYAEKHRGICLGFDVPDTSLCKVEYLKDRVPLRSLLPPAFGSHSMPGPIFRMKFQDWGYEREWRRMVRLSEARGGGDHHFWPFGDDLALREVIAGARCNVTEQRLRRTLGTSEHKVAFVQARPAFRSFGVVIQQRGFRRRTPRRKRGRQ